MADGWQTHPGEHNVGMRFALESVGALSLIVVGLFAGLWGIYLLGGEENAPKVGTWMLILALLLCILGAGLIVDLRRLRSERKRMR